MYGCENRKITKKEKLWVSVFNSIEFAGTREVLRTKQKALKSSEKGNKPNASRSLTDPEVDELHRKGQLGSETPEAMLNTLWFNNCTHFGMRGGKEHRDLCWGDIQLKEGISAGEAIQFLEFTERQTKTRTGENRRNIRPVKPRMYENKNKERCPVQLYKAFAQRRPEDCNDSDYPFYLAVNNVKERNETQAWFKRTAVGVNKLYAIMKAMAEKANLTNKEDITNHSARKTMILKLNDNQVPPTHIMQISGHKNVQSINSYSSLNSRQLQTISTIISTESQTRERSSQPMSHSELTANCGLSSIFSNSTISGNIEININNHASRKPPVKRKRLVIESSDSSKE